MGNNCGSEGASKGHKEFLKNDATPKFRVYIHRRSRVIHAWLIIHPDTIQLELETNSKSKNVTTWPLNLIRRYGYTSAGIFFFESGRRCLTGEGFHCFQTQHADVVFRMVQERVHACVGPPDQADGRSLGRRSLGPEAKVDGEHTKINHLQRFPSEGNSVVGDYRPPSTTGGSWSPASASAYRMRKVVLPAAPRPRSVSDVDDNRKGPHLLPRHTNSVGVVGNIISMSHNPSASDEASYTDTVDDRPAESVIPSYVNISPNGDLSFKFARTRTNSSSSLGSLPSSPSSTISKVFSMKWDAGGGSTSLCVHVPHPSAAENAYDLPFIDGRIPANYVNVQSPLSRSTLMRETTPILNYVDVRPESPASTLTRSRGVDARQPPNYTQIDPEKTKAIQAAVERGAAGRRRIE